MAGLRKGKQDVSGLGSKSAIGGVIFLAAAIFSLILGAFELWDRIFPDRVEKVSLETAPQATSVAPEPQDALTEGHALAVAIEEMLMSMICTKTELGRISVAERNTSAKDSTSGFEGLYLEGNVVVTFDGTPHSFRLAGSGKGPAREVEARIMAVDGLSKSIRATDEFLLFCKGD